MTAAPLEQLAYEAYERTRWPGRPRVPWDHGALAESAAAWKAAVDAGTAPLREQLAIAAGALRDIRDSYDTGTFAHAAAHTALDDIGGVKPCAPGEVEQLREQLAVLRERIANTAAGMKLSAQATAPSKKSAIETECAAALLGLLEAS